jgi:hypothetical protein
MACSLCGAVGALVFTGRWWARGSRWPGRGGIEDRQTPVAECICTACRKRFRVLPVEIAPYKSYTRPVIETACAAYLTAQQQGRSLRQTVRAMGTGHPDSSCVHGWLGGLGARALGRLDRHGQGPPVAALIAQSAQGLGHELLSRWSRAYPVAPSQYRSLARRERLEACVRLFDTAGRLFPQAAYPFTAWEQWLEARFHVTAWGFPARFPCTAIQQQAPRRVAVPCAPSRPQPACRDGRGAGRGSRRTKGNVHGARGPP